MKLYVLDESRSEERAPSDKPARVRSRRTLIAAVGLASIAVAVLYAYLDRAGARDAGAEQLNFESKARLPAVVSAESTPVVPLADQKTPFVAASSSYPPEAPGAAPLAPSSVTRKNGKYFVDLHGVEASAALAMMSEATGMKVVGGDALLKHPVRLTAKLVAASPVAAWQSVFGDVASFAVSCPGKTCVVHIVSAASAASSQPLAAAAAAAGPQYSPQYGIAEPAETPAPGTTVYPQDN
jgi:hypothetical protein